jgi:hypothetical protein
MRISMPVPLRHLLLGRKFAGSFEQSELVSTINGEVKAPGFTVYGFVRV